MLYYRYTLTAREVGGSEKSNGNSSRASIVADNGDTGECGANDITLKGKKGAILDGTPPADTGTSLTGNGITVGAGVSGVTIEGFKIRNHLMVWSTKSHPGSGHTPVHIQHLTGDIPGFIGGKKSNRLSHIAG